MYMYCFFLVLVVGPAAGFPPLANVLSPRLAPPQKWPPFLLFTKYIDAQAIVELVEKGVRVQELRRLSAKYRHIKGATTPNASSGVKHGGKGGVLYDTPDIPGAAASASSPTMAAAAAASSAIAAAAVGEAPAAVREGREGRESPSKLTSKQGT